MAIDSESVAYIPPKVGTNEKAAAIVQVATKDYVVIFVVHEWLALYDSFKAFLESDVEKVALNIRHDTAAINAKFPEIRLEAMVELSSRAKAIARDECTEGYSLKALAKCLLSLFLDKRIEHEKWAKSRYSPRQVAYAAADPYCVYLVVEKLLDMYTASGRTRPTKIEQLPTNVLDPLEDEALAAHETTGGAEEEEASEPVACTRHDRRRGRARDADASDDEADLRQEDHLDVDDDDDEEAVEAAEQRARDESDEQAPNAILARCMELIDRYAGGDDMHVVELPAGLSAADRKVLHSYTDQRDEKIFHWSEGGEEHRRFCICKLPPPTLLDARRARERDPASPRLREHCSRSRSDSRDSPVPYAQACGRSRRVREARRWSRSRQGNIVRPRLAPMAD